MYNYYFFRNIEITLYMHGEKLMAIKCQRKIHSQNEDKILI